MSNTLELDVLVEMEVSAECKCEARLSYWPNTGDFIQSQSLIVVERNIHTQESEGQIDCNSYAENCFTMTREAIRSAEVRPVVLTSEES